MMQRKLTIIQRAWPRKVNIAKKSIEYIIKQAYEKRY